MNNRLFLSVAVLDMFNKALNLILLPIMLSLFNSDDFGELAICLSVAGIFTMILNSGTVAAALKVKYLYKDNLDQPIFESLTCFISLVGLFCILLSFFFDINYIYVVAILIGFFAHLKNLWFNENKSSGNILIISKVYLLVIIINLVVSLLLISYFDLKSEGRLLGILFSYSPFIILTKKYFKNFKNKLKCCFKFFKSFKSKIFDSFPPFILYNLPGYIDKPVMLLLFDMSTVGNWFILYSIISPLQVLSGSAVAVFEKQIFELRSNKIIEFILKFKKYFVIMFISYCLYFFFAVFIIPSFVSKFNIGLSLLAIVLFSELPIFMSRLFTINFLVFEKESVLSQNLLIKSLLFFLFLYLFKEHGLFGIAYTLVVVNFILFFLRLRIFKL